MRRKISADVDGGLSGVSRCADTGARTPIGVSGIVKDSVDKDFQVAKAACVSSDRLLGFWTLNEKSGLSG